jgi:hypothetical protein
MRPLIQEEFSWSRYLRASMTMVVIDPLGAATGADRLQIRLYDLLAHGWDLARATGQPGELPNDLAEQVLAFARVQLSTQPRTGRFDPAQAISDEVPAIDRARRLPRPHGQHRLSAVPLPGDRDEGLAGLPANRARRPTARSAAEPAELGDRCA